MEKTTAGLIGAIAGLATMGVAQAATTPAMSPTQALDASSYADLLEPIPNAGALLQADSVAQAQRPLNSVASLQLADWHGEYEDGYHRSYHHHHHYRHYGYYNRHYHHHHHHHRHGDNRFVGSPGIGGFVVHDGR